MRNNSGCNFLPVTEAEQDAVVDLIAFDPTSGDLITGTGGLRKVRVGSAQEVNAAVRGSSTISTTRTFQPC